MLAGLGTFLSNIVASAQTSLVLPIVTLALLVGGGIWATGNPQGGRQWIIGGLIGGAVMLLAVTIASGIRAATSGAPAVPAGMIVFMSFL